MSRTVNIIVGAPLTGKTTYITNNYSDTSKYYIFDYARTYLQMFDSFDDETEENVAEVMTEMSIATMEEVFFNGKDLVVEFCLGETEKDGALKDLINEFKDAGFEVNLVQLDCEVEEARRRNEEVQMNPSYYSSYHLNDVVLTILPNFIEDFIINHSMNN